MTWDRVRAWRLSQQRLDRHALKSRLLDVARNVCGIHAPSRRMTSAAFGNTRGRGSRIDVTIRPLRKFAAAQKKQIREEADRLGRFLEGRVTVSYGS